MDRPRFDPELDRKRARLDPAVRRRVLADNRRIVIAGVSGWVGRTTVALLHEALGPEIFAERVLCFGSRAATHELDGGVIVTQRPLEELPGLEPEPTLLFNLAFLTMDKVAGMDRADYVRINRALTETILKAADTIGVDRLFLASSGAAAYTDDDRAAENLRLYGGLKRADEAVFANWAQANPTQRRAVIARIYSVSGPWINKHDVYALASLILNALAGEPVRVHAPMRVWRGYVAVREVVSLVFAALLAEEGGPVVRVDTGGEPVELGELATQVATTLGGVPERQAITRQDDNRYLGDHGAYREMLARYGILHLPLDEQIVETAAYLARHSGFERD
jgi:nucleoside-diphosphate-sugar epimerase